MDGQESWQLVVGFPEYEVSDWGRVRSYKVRRRGRYPYRILKPSGGRYLGVGLRRDGKTFRRRVATLVLEAFVGPCPKRMEICHSDSNPHNNHLGNLRYDTRYGNLMDCPDLLSKEAVISLREDATRGLSDEKLAGKYGLSVYSAMMCRLGYTYNFIGGPIINRRRKLSDEQVAKIRLSVAMGQQTQMALAREFHVSESHISRIAHGLRRNND